MGAGTVKLLIANIFFTPDTYGGATIVAEALARELKKAFGWEIAGFSSLCNGDLPDYHVIRTRSDGIDSFRVNLPQRQSYVDGYRNDSVLAAFERVLDATRPDAVHVHCIQSLSIELIAACRKRGIPTVLSVHDFWWICERQFMLKPGGTYCFQDPIRLEACTACNPDFDRLIRRSEALREAYLGATVVTHTSRHSLELHERSGFRHPNAHVVENGVTLPGDGFWEKQAKRRSADPRCAFGYIGGPTETKGWSIIQEAFSTLGDASLRGHLIDGPSGHGWWDRLDLGGLAGEWTIHKRFDQSTLDDFYAKIDVLVFLSQWKETFGLGIREAASRGIHVIATEGSGAMEGMRPDLVTAFPIGIPPSRLQGRIRELIAKRPEGPADLTINSYAHHARAISQIIGRVRNHTTKGAA